VPMPVLFGVSVIGGPLVSIRGWRLVWNVSGGARRSGPDVSREVPQLQAVPCADS